MKSSDLIMVPTGTTAISEVDDLGDDFKLYTTVCKVGLVDDNDTPNNMNDDTYDNTGTLTAEGGEVTTANLKPWEVLFCEFTNDNTAFVKIKKITTVDVEENLLFNFLVDQSFGENFEVPLTVITGSSTTMTDLIMVPTGTTSIEEILEDIPPGWGLLSVQCEVGTVDDNGTPDDMTDDTFNNDGVPTGNTGLDKFAELKPWEILVCTFTNEENKEGLTPGFWRANAQNWNAGAWSEDPQELFKDIFVPGAPNANYVLKLNPNFDFFDGKCTY